MRERYCIVIWEEIVRESFAVTDTTSAILLFRSKSKDNGFHATERLGETDEHCLPNTFVRFCIIKVSSFYFGSVWEFHNCNRVPFEIYL